MPVAARRLVVAALPLCLVHGSPRTRGWADAGAGCGHVRGVGGGAGPITGDVTWWWSQTPEAFPAVPGPLDPKGYYNVNLPGGPAIAFNVSVGHYSAHPAPGVALELQVAP